MCAYWSVFAVVEISLWKAGMDGSDDGDLKP